MAAIFPHFLASRRFLSPFRKNGASRRPEILFGRPNDPALSSYVYLTHARDCDIYCTHRTWKRFNSAWGTFKKFTTLEKVTRQFITLRDISHS